MDPMRVTLLVLLFASLLPRSIWAASPVMVDSDAKTLGIPLRSGDEPPQVTVVTRTGYLVTYESSTGAIMGYLQDAVGNNFAGLEPFFESADCTGQPYAPMGSSPSGLAGGVVATADPAAWGASLVYVPKAPTAIVKTLKSSRYMGGACQNRSAWPKTAAVVVPLANDPAITAVSGPVVPPLHLEIVSDCIFSSGFQCAGP